MKQFLVTRSAETHEVRSVQVYEPDELIEAAVARDVARDLESLEAEIFLGEDLVDVVRSHERYFQGAAA